MVYFVTHVILLAGTDAEGRCSAAVLERTPRFRIYKVRLGSYWVESYTVIT